MSPLIRKILSLAVKVMELLRLLDQLPRRRFFFKHFAHRLIPVACQSPPCFGRLSAPKTRLLTGDRVATHCDCSCMNLHRRENPRFLCLLRGKGLRDDHSFLDMGKTKERTQSYFIKGVLRVSLPNV